MPPKAAETGSILRGTNSGKTGIGVYFYFCVVFPLFLSLFFFCLFLLLHSPAMNTPTTCMSISCDARACDERGAFSSQSPFSLARQGFPPFSLYVAISDFFVFTLLFFSTTNNANV